MGEVEELRKVIEDHESRIRLSEKERMEDRKASALSQQRIEYMIKMVRWQFFAFGGYVLMQMTDIKLPTILKLLSTIPPLEQLGNVYPSNN